MKCSILIKNKNNYRLIPWIIKEEDELIFEPYQEFLSMVVTMLKNNNADYRESEFIQLIVALDGLPVMWPHVQHLFPRVNPDPVKLAERQQRLEDALILIGQAYDDLKRKDEHHSIRTQH